MAGARLPLRAMKHAYVVTDSLGGDARRAAERARSRPVDLSQGTGRRARAGGYEVNPEFWHGVGESDDFAFTLFELDWETFMQNTEGHIQRCPAGRERGHQVDSVRARVVHTRPQAARRARALGARALPLLRLQLDGHDARRRHRPRARHVDRHGRRPPRTRPVRVRPRALPSGVRRRRRHGVTQATHESYAKTYSIVFPHDEPLSRAAARAPPLHDALRAAASTRHATALSGRGSSHARRRSRRAQALRLLRRRRRRLAARARPRRRGCARRAR